MASIFNSRSPGHKTPFGAVSTKEEVRFALCVPAEYGCKTPRIFICKDGAEGDGTILPYEKTTQEGDWFALSVRIPEPGLYFYWFDLWVDYRKLYRGFGGEATETTGTGEPWQLTVYDADFKTPDALHGGVMYQIFPDRFYEGDPNKPLSYNERIYRRDKSKEPYFWPDDQKDGYLTRDYFGGDLKGIEEKLPYLKDLGVDWIYLNPIVEAHANHRYNTADYLNVDPYLGTNQDFVRLCQKAAGMGMRIVLDGVFSHTGADSIYFNKEGRYPSVGAWQGPQSPYRSWYHFYPDGGYDSWWGFETLPACDKNNRSFRNFICGEGGVIDTWMQRGAFGFRLDVADELPDSFIEDIRGAVKRHGDDKLLLGEVWEDATTKMAYNVRRQYFEGRELDGVMNYPFRTAILQFLRLGDGVAFAQQVLALCENYPPPALAACTTHLATHDTERAITALVGEPVEGHDRNWQSGRRLNAQQYELGVRRMKMALLLQFTLPGIPCVYYGDEIAMQGYKDPFNRGFFNWDSAETRLKPLIRQLADLRHRRRAFKGTQTRFTAATAGLVAYERGEGREAVGVALNLGELPARVTLLGKEVEVAPSGMLWKEAE